MSDKSRCPMCFSNDDHTPQCLNRNYETDLRAQIAADLQERLVPADQTEVAVWIRNQAARIAEEGAFHCCAHPKCPGGSICCCPDAEEGNTK